MNRDSFGLKMGGTLFLTRNAYEISAIIFPFQEMEFKNKVVHVFTLYLFSIRMF